MVIGKHLPLALVVCAPIVDESVKVLGKGFLVFLRMRPVGVNRER